jgi:hypothetical protein
MRPTLLDWDGRRFQSNRANECLRSSDHKAGVGWLPNASVSSAFGAGVEGC